MGKVVIREQSFGGSATAYVPGVVEKGKAVSVDLCWIYVFEGQLISEWHDYG